MAKNSVFDWDTTAANNTDVGGIGITGNNLPRNLDDAEREVMAQIASFVSYLGIQSTDNIWNKTQIFAGADASGETVMEFRTDRPWFIRQRGDDASTLLSFENTTLKQIGFANEAVWSQSNIVLDPKDTDASIKINDHLVYHRGNVLATVSQSGGIPTGGMIERGSNANGQYTRFADGTQICMAQVARDLTAAAGYYSYAFPATFSTVYGLGWGSSNTAPGANQGALRSSFLGATSTTWEFNQGAVGSSSVTLYLLAIGRWF